MGAVYSYEGHINSGVHFIFNVIDDIYSFDGSVDYMDHLQMDTFVTWRDNWGGDYRSTYKGANPVWIATDNYYGKSPINPPHTNIGVICGLIPSFMGGQNPDIYNDCFELPWCFTTGSAPTSMNIGAIGLTTKYNRTDNPQDTSLPYSTNNNFPYFNYYNTDITNIGSVTISTNVPIFTNRADAIAYCINPQLSENYTKAINYKGPNNFDDTTKEYYIYDRYQECSVNKGIVTVTDSTQHTTYERILYNGTDIALYSDSSNPFLVHLKYGSGLLGSYHSYTSLEEVNDAEYSDFSFELEYDGPWYREYNSRFSIVDYTGYLGILTTNIPLWDNEADADDYLAGNKDITEATNWDKISGDNVYKDIITNLTELPEEETEFGEVMTRNFFSQMYLCNVSTLAAISNSLFDYDVTTLSGLWEDIKKGLEMYGTDPMQVVQGLRFYPFDLTSIFQNVQPQQYIYFGAYQLPLQESVYKIVYANGYKDLGSVTIKRTFKDWRDFEPYTKLSIYLPYVGRYQLDLKKYYDKTINVRYYIDIRTGACCVCLIANGILLDWFDGIIGTEMPITLTDYSSYAQNQINIIMRNAGMGTVGEAAFGNVASKVISAKTAGDTLDAAVATREAGAFASLESQTAGAGVASGAMGAIGMGAGIAGIAAMTIMKTQFDLLRDGTTKYTKSRPGSSAMLNNFLPQYPTFMFEIQEIDESPYLNELYGRPSNASGRLGDFSGYFEAEDIMLICPIATDNERQEIIDLVRSGIYI